MLLHSYTQKNRLPLSFAAGDDFLSRRYAVAAMRAAHDRRICLAVCSATGRHPVYKTDVVWYNFKEDADVHLRCGATVRWPFSCCNTNAEVYLIGVKNHEENQEARIARAVPVALAEFPATVRLCRGCIGRVIGFLRFL